MASENHIFKLSNAGGFKALTRYPDMLAGNTVWNPWEPQGAFDALATVTVPSGGAASIDFTGIPTGYKHLQIRGLTRGTDAAANRDVSMRYNGDSTSGNYFWHRLFGDGATTYGQWNTNPVAQMFVGLTPSAGSTASVFGAQVIDILDYASTTKTKTVRSLWGYDANGSGLNGIASAAWVTSSAPITSLSFICQSGNFAQYTTFALYGIK